MDHITNNTTNYINTLEDIKQRIKTAQIKAHLSVNREMLILYWQIGNTILDRQEQEGWGTKITRKLSEDLRKAFPNMKGFSYTNLRYMQRFADTYPDLLICQAPLGKFEKDQEIFYSNCANIILNITWYHNITLLDKLQNKEKRLWYARKTIENGWSRNILLLQIKSNLYKRQADKEIKTNNFQTTLPENNSDLANDIFKDEYNFDFIDAPHGKLKERTIEKALIDDVIKFLLELGKGFSFVGKQYHLEAANKDYYCDLLFYHLDLRSFIIIELKTTEFKPEYAGKMVFYLAQIDKKLKKDTDNYSIGIILCPNSPANKEIQEDTISYITKPMGVAGYELADKKQELPKELKPLEDLKKLI